MENIKIKELHESSAFGILVETGCGLAVSNSLLEVAGASKTVYFAECPYSKEYQTFKYGESKDRAVSWQNVKHIMNYNAALDKPDNVSFIYVSSFQIGEMNDTSTHGWIGITVKGGSRRYFHISIHAPLTRKQYIEKISQIGIDILHYYAVAEPTYTSAGTNWIPSNCCIDIALDDKGQQIDLNMMFVALRKEEDENFICIKDGMVVRMEELFRDKEKIVLYKGSFNPIHSAHMHTAEMAKEKYGIEPVFVISSSVYQKGWIQSDDLRNRVEILNELGYSVIITKDGFFNKNTEYIRRKFKQPIVYVVGSDTLNRILESSYNILNPTESERYKHFGNQLQQIRSAEEKEITAEDLAENEEMALGHYINNFKKDFVGVSFFVVNRPGSELNKDANRVAEYYTLVEEHPEFYHISSTKIRLMIENNDLESARKLVPEKILNKYINNYKNK